PRPHPSTTPLSLHDALPIYLLLAQGGDQLDAAHPPLAEHHVRHHRLDVAKLWVAQRRLHAGMGEAVPSERLEAPRQDGARVGLRSEEHRSELQSLAYLVCRL